LIINTRKILKRKQGSLEELKINMEHMEKI
jgi:hypothetical protein